MAGEWRLNPSVHRAKGDRLVHARVLPVCDNVIMCYFLLPPDPSSGFPQAKEIMKNLENH